MDFSAFFYVVHQIGTAPLILRACNQELFYNLGIPCL